MSSPMAVENPLNRSSLRQRVQLPSQPPSHPTTTDESHATEYSSRHVHYASRALSLSQPSTVQQQRQRVQLFQRRWKAISQDLPPQLSRRHVGMIAIGGVIGTGLFLGSANSLRYGGPVGALLGYCIIGTVVYSLCMCVGEMISFLPNVGGVVGIADLYVDPALGFSMGWAAWYNWTITLPAEIAAAAVVVRFWDSKEVVPTWALSLLFLILAVAINCFPSRIYGEFEFIFSTFKVITIVLIIIISLLLDVGASGHGVILFRNFKHPFAQSYRNQTGSLAQFLGFWAVLMQASFSFFGSEVAGIAAGEVVNAHKNVPAALKRVWIRICLFYIGGIFCAGLLVDSGDPKLTLNDGTAQSSPFVIAFDNLNIKALPSIVNASILLSAWSAAASDVYISSRFMFFLARRRHAPKFLAYLLNNPWYYTKTKKEKLEADLSDDDYGFHQSQDDSDGDAGVYGLSDVAASEEATEEVDPEFLTDEEEDEDNYEDDEDDDDDDRPADIESTEPSTIPPRKKTFVLPLPAVVLAGLFGLLSFLGTSHSSTQQGGEAAFSWLQSVASVASLQSWAALLFVYIRWHQGTVYAENKYKSKAMEDDAARDVIAQIEAIKEHRHSWQPYLAYYGFGICLIVLITNGWSVFVHADWSIAEIPGQPSSNSSRPVAEFLAAYISIPVFLLFTLGYKLIYQTKTVRLEDMTWSREDAPEEVEDDSHVEWKGMWRWLNVF